MQRSTGRPSALPMVARPTLPVVSPFTKGSCPLCLSWIAPNASLGIPNLLSKSASLQTESHPLKQSPTPVVRAVAKSCSLSALLPFREPPHEISSSPEDIVSCTHRLHRALPLALLLQCSSNNLIGHGNTIKSDSNNRDNENRQQVERTEACKSHGKLALLRKMSSTCLTC